MREIEATQGLKVKPVLWMNGFEFVPLCDNNLGSGFRAYADPIDALRERNRSVSLNRHFKAAVVQSRNQWNIQLQSRLAARAHDQFSASTGRTAK